MTSFSNLASYSNLGKYDLLFTLKGIAPASISSPVVVKVIVYSLPHEILEDLSCEISDMVDEGCPS